MERVCTHTWLCACACVYARAHTHAHTWGGEGERERRWGEVFSENAHRDKLQGVWKSNTRFLNVDLVQLFSNFILAHYNHLKHLLKHRLWDTTPRFWLVGFSGAPNIASLTTSQVMLLLLVRGPNFENHRSSS